ncbi:hypothetical protein ASD44_16635 [Mesorhizobium sp. Root554]|uniref:glycosyltransferase family 2 protein n=2 Tax=unclassified Mesorhizobium TaxID=325217 RepID=UPI0006F2EF40|nr:glycosyltransferase family A protein [Mesorhizobium sp. Root554]KQZ15501.1 hypothetical protein ASD27_16640 [Mesorhizobium sp. Root1471]KQZ38010.1 hypothetical protein ASD44_16635 [Mesorhizobium sp. Root554]
MFPEGSEIVLSMVVATLGRSDELSPLLQSLCGQSRRDFEVIVVDQNPDDRLVPVLASKGAELNIVHLRTDRHGVCRARNLGAAHARGEWLLFPDDDCWYPDDFLGRLDAVRASHPADFYSGRAAAPDGRDIMGAFESSAMPITRANVWTTLIEWMLTVRKAAFTEAGGFDENIGPGAKTPWGAYEVQDLALNLLAHGRRGYYDPSLTGHHPEDLSDRTTATNIAKMRVYSGGLGYVMRRHGYALPAFLPSLLRPLAGVAVYTASGKPGMARRSWQIFLGRWTGWRDAPRPPEPEKARVS